ncbi:MAG: metalloregulator ArsR/SmtB family transcription factor [Nocardioidaceae bacterium]
MPGAQTPAPTGEATTRARVARSILENGPSTAAALAERLGLTPAAVRRHLDQLVEQGAVEAVEQRPAGSRGRGRPAKHFRLTGSGRDRFDQRYDDLAAEALRFLAETGGDDAVSAFARRRVAFIERDFHAVAGANPGLSPAEVLARVLSQEGYAASVRELPIVGTGTGAEQLCQQHCPVSHVAHEFPQLCEAETEAISRVLGTHVARLATIAHGDGVCTTCIPEPQHHTTTDPHQDGAAS